MEEPITAFASIDSAWLSQQLSRCKTAAGEQVWVGISREGELISATLERTGAINADLTAQTRRPLGCITKALTGTLAMHCLDGTALDFSSEVGALLQPATAQAQRALSRITIRHLLNHSHGLDASHVDAAEHSGDGRIDLQQLCQVLSARPPLFEPGFMYSYSNAGAWLTAAILERVCKSRYSDLLVANVLLPAGITVVRDSADEPPWCPATGRGLSLSIPELLSFAHWFCSRRSLTEHRELQQRIAPPGWSVEGGAGAGWKHFGSGWYGHNMTTPAQSLILRIHPERKLAIAVAGTGATTASMAMLRIFGRRLPEYASLKLPKPIAAADRAVLERCPGVYANAAMSVRISLRHQESRLQADIESASPPTPSRGIAAVSTGLQAGTDNAFLAEPHVTTFQWIQFLTPDARGYVHLWDGRQVLRRVGEETSSP